MQHIGFYVWKTPRVYWDPELEAKNLEYLRGINSSYYAHIAETHAPFLDGESRETCLNAASALRMAYGQGLETLFALLYATMQAPACVLGWMQQYRNQDLREMVAAIGSSAADPYVLTGFRPSSWNTLSTGIFARVDLEDEANRAYLSSGFGRLWAAFARDFLDEKATQEYNALKHGSRPKMGGFSLAIGLQEAPEVPAKPEAMHSLGGSKYGSTFFVPEGLALRGLHSQPRRVSLNWMPENLVHGLEMLSLSLTNVSAYLRSLNGDKREDCQFFGPEQADAFDAPWAKHPGVISSSMDTRITAEHIRPWSRQEVLDLLDQHYPASS